uniref:NADH dehydrogenase subunit 4 n=1 Tax=Amblyomma parvum TaxID=251391 RepID=UPI002E77D996|nr:NADH dehydrogenase subunit 4 [Amblyomma parvum]WQF69065.1 NADH dehydrogenase subunit 4 [Amblyomma parvum]
MLVVIFLSFSIVWLSFLMNFCQLIIIMMMMTMLMVLMMIGLESFLVSSMIGVDLMSMMLMLLSIWISFLMILASNISKTFLNKMFLFYVNLMLFLLMICFSTLNLLIFYFFFEAVLFPIIMLIFGWGNQPERLQAGFYMLMYTIFGSFPLLISLLYFYAVNFTVMYIYMDWISFKIGIGFLFLLLGFLVKIPMFFMHLWLPKAHVEAPISGSMMLAGVLLKLGIYGIFRFKNIMMFELMKFSEIFIVMSLWGGVVISLFCLYQVDIKSLIAYSSVCHMGVVLGGVLSFSFYSKLGAILLMIGHGLCSSGLFCLANLIYERTSTRSIMLFKGMKAIFPSLVLWWFLFCIINMSAPMTMNLWGEFFLSLSILKMSIFYFPAIMLIIFMSACYSIYMYSYINHGGGWVVWSLKAIELREYNLLFLHLLPMILWFLKILFFCKWM